MSRSHSHKQKYERNDQTSQDDLLEGTSARTRPFSFDDIMLARKNKANATKQGISYAGVTDIALAPDTGPLAPECHKQTDEASGSIDNRLSLEDSQKLNSSRKGDNNVSRENRKLVSDKYEGLWETHPKLKSIVDKNISSDRVTASKTQKRHKSYKERNSRENDGSFSDNSDYGSNKRQFRASHRKEKVFEARRGKSEIERKQLHYEDMQVSRKRKPGGHINNDPENKKQYARGVMLSDKLTDRGRDKSEKEARYKHHNVEESQRGRITSKKHGSEKKEVETTRVSHEEFKSKRRGSQNREHAKERSERSPSQSPNMRKQTSRDKREQGELLSNSTKDRPGKENPDDKKISSNGSSYQYRRNNSSGLGGYSPRKRKTDAGAKTPSPTHRSPARRTAGWDLQPIEKESALGGSTFVDIHSSLNLSINVQESRSVALMTPVVMKPIGVSPQALSSQMHAVESIQLTQATRPMRRLYVENLPASASEKDLIECINNFFLSSGINHIHGTQPCISCIIHKEKGQALLEFLTPEDASAALSFDGISFLGSKLKLRRPKDYASITTGVPDKSVVASNSISRCVEDSPHKIFIGGISKFLPSKMLLEIAKVFGPVKAFHFQFIADNEPCAFLEYVDHSVTSKACAGLNGMKLGGKLLTAVFATPDVVMENVSKLPCYGVPEHAKPLLEEPSSVLKLKNALDPEGFLLLSELELEEILEDIRIECSRFGTVKSVNVAKPMGSLGSIDAQGTHTTDELVDRPNAESGNRSSAKETLGDYISDSAVFDQSDSHETQNESRNSQALKSGYGCDSTSSGVILSAETEDINRSMVPGDKSSGEMIAGNLMKDETCSLPVDDDGDVPAPAPSKEPSSQEQRSSGPEFETKNNAVVSVSPTNIEMEEHPEELKLQEYNTKDTSSVKCERKELDAPDPDDKKDEWIDIDSVFEPGSIFVEYKRAEAARIAAHCLHGRLFDGRAITVGYISHDLYQARFRK